MHFQINNIILWPKNTQKDIVNIEFNTDKVGVITGGSSRGKSALLAIVDYCLAASISKIPTRKIRDKTSWFGIKIQLKNNNYLLIARPEPGEDSVSNDMYMKESSQIEIPIIAPTPNVNIKDVKFRLDSMAGLTKISFIDPDEPSGFGSRPGFRDLISFNFQPQHLIANQSTLFYKTDVFKYREKLISIFPYVLGAVDDDYLISREELKVLKREVKAIRKDIEKRKNLIDNWIGSLRSVYVKAIELGLLDAPFPEDNWTSMIYIRYLRIIQKQYTGQIPQIPLGISTAVSQRVTNLEKREIDLSYEIYKQKHRYELINRLEKSNIDYRQSLLIKNNRLNSVSWFNALIDKENICPFCESQNNSAKNRISELLSISENLTTKESVLHDNYQTLSNEKLNVHEYIRQKEKEINAIREELNYLRSGEDIEQKRLQNTLDIYRFIGNLESELGNYEEFNDNSDLLEELREKEHRISEMHNSLNEENTRNKLKVARKDIERRITFYAEFFGAENSQDTIIFDEENLTLNFISETGRDNALYEIGGGANYMQYHLSTLLALHEYFISKENSPIPSFIFFDQPSQVYFPDTRADQEDLDKQEDIIKVKKIFEAFEKCNERTNGKLQIIAIEHVGDYAWEGLDNVQKIRRWRGEDNDSYLIPKDW